MAMRKQLLTIVLLLLSFIVLVAQSAVSPIFQTGSEGPRYDYDVEPNKPRGYYDSGGPEKPMRGLYTLTLIRIQPKLSDHHITILFDDIKIGEFDEMRIYDGAVDLDNYLDEDGYIYDWPKGVTPIALFKGTPADTKMRVSASSSSGVLSIAFRCNSDKDGWRSMVYCVPNGGVEPSHSVAEAADIKVGIGKLFDEEGKAVVQRNHTFYVTPAEGTTSVRINWGDEEKEYALITDEETEISHIIKEGTTIKLFGKLSSFNASEAGIKSVVFGRQETLEELYLSDNLLDGLDLSSLPNLRKLNVAHNSLKNLDISHSPELEELYAMNNKFSELRTAMNTKLRLLHIDGGQLLSLDLTANTSLKNLSLGNNPFTTFPELSHLSNIRTLKADNLFLSSIDLKPFAQLAYLSLKKNKLTTVDVSNNEKLSTLHLQNNNLDACAINDLLFTLPNRKGQEEYGELNLSGNPGVLGAASKDLGKKGWMIDEKGNGADCSMARIRFVNKSGQSFVTKVSGQEVPEWSSVAKGSEVVVEMKIPEGLQVKTLLVNGVEVVGNTFVLKEHSLLEVKETTKKEESIAQKTATIVTDMKVGEQLALKLEASGPIVLKGVKEDYLEGEYDEGMYYYTLTDQTVEIYGSFSGFQCSRNKISSIDLSGNNDLIYVECYQNGLKTLKVDKCPNLEEIFAQINNLTELNLSDCVALSMLDCSDNQLTTLSVNSAPDLELLRCYNNQLTSLSFDKCTMLTEVMCFHNKLVALKVDNLPRLKTLNVGANLLTQLDLTGNTSLNMVVCYLNKISGEEMSKTIESLTSLKGKEQGQITLIDTTKEIEANVCYVQDVKAAKEKNWLVQNFMGSVAGTIPYEGSIRESVEEVAKQIPIQIKKEADGVLLFFDASFYGKIASIYSLDGSLVKNFVVSSEQYVQLSEGFYVLSFENESIKFLCQ